MAPTGEPTKDRPEPPEARLLSNIRQLTFEGRRAGEGYFSRDGLRMIFQSERESENPFYQMYLLDMETGDTERVSPGIGKTTCGWIHPDGDRVLFASTHEDPEAKAKQQAEFKDREAGTPRRYAWDYDDHYDIYERGLRSDALKNLTHIKGYDAEGSWSPDGSLVAFASNRHAYAAKLPPNDAEAFERDRSVLMDIYIMKADGSGVRRLTDEKGYDGGPFFSPDGRRICWRHFSVDGATAEVFAMNVDGSDKRQITRLGAMSWAPFYHPSGEHLIFTTNVHGFGNFELYLVDTAGLHESVRVTYTDGFDGLPAFAPDGRRLAWTSNRAAGKQSQLFLADWNHAEARSLLGLAGGPGTQAAMSQPATMPNDADVAFVEGQTQPEISAEDIRLHVAKLASERMEGRMTGSPGETLATEYVAQAFKHFGLAPGGDDGTYFQSFTFTAGVSIGPDNSVTVAEAKSNVATTAPAAISASDAAAGERVTSRKSLDVDKDWRPLAFSKTGRFESADVVFAGYGILAPQEGEHEEYDSFVHLDIKDKWVLVLRYMPERIAPERRQQFSRYSSLRYKAMIVRDLGARGLIVVSGPNSGVKEQLPKLAFDAALAGSGIPAIAVTDAVVDNWLKPAGKDLKTLQDGLDDGSPQMGFTLAAVQLRANIDIRKETRTGRNVLGRLPTATDAKGLAAVLVGAHVDHLGRGLGANSLARPDEAAEIHYGADDNASGVAGVLEIAEQMSSLQSRGQFRPVRDVWFAAWSGEELGLLGSSHFVEQLAEQAPKPDKIQSKIAACLNMDMIGRLGDKLILQGVGSSTVWRREIEQRNLPVGLAITLQDDAYLPTDATSFYLKGVPILNAFTGSHAEYHTPRDTPDTLNYGGAAKVSRFMALVARSLATRQSVPEYVAVERSGEKGERAHLRAYLGSIPDYAASDTLGVKLSGVSKDGPAEKAGVRGGDVIVELAGRKIENIYDYTYAIEALKIGQPVKLVVLREGKKVTLTVTPGSRE